MGKKDDQHTGEMQLSEEQNAGLLQVFSAIAKEKMSEACDEYAQLLADALDVEIVSVKLIDATLTAGTLSVEFKAKKEEDR